MSFIRNGYVCCKKGRYKEYSSFRDTYLIKYKTKTKTAGNSGYLHIYTIYFPKEYIGKRIKLKVEVVENV